jgi:hypothetical protein
MDQMHASPLNIGLNKRNPAQKLIMAPLPIHQDAKDACFEEA